MSRASGALLAIVVLVVGFPGCLDVDPTSSEAADRAPDAANQTPVPPWPPVEEATVRPGVGIGEGARHVSGIAPGSYCTANFVFTSPDNATLYVGTAAHCVRGEIGDEVMVGGPDGVATRLAYSSWETMNLSSEDHAEACARLDVSLDDSATCWNDFALLEVLAQDRGEVHPTMLRFGGPTGVGEEDAAGDRVLTFGNSFQREAAGDALDGRPGVIVDVNEWRVLVHTGAPSTVGDPGSPVTLDDGRAIGTMTYLHHLPPSTNGVSRLDALLDFAREEGGMAVDLATWDTSMLPTIPAPLTASGGR